MHFILGFCLKKKKGKKLKIRLIDLNTHHFWIFPVLEKEIRDQNFTSLQQVKNIVQDAIKRSTNDKQENMVNILQRL